MKMLVVENEAWKDQIFLHATWQAWDFAREGGNNNMSISDAWDNHFAF